MAHRSSEQYAILRHLPLVSRFLVFVGLNLTYTSAGWIADPLNHWFGRRNVIFGAAIFSVLAPIGSAIIPLAALINHSCDPNVSFCFPRTSSSKLEEPLLHVVAVQDLPAGTEVGVLLYHIRDSASF